MRPFQLLIKPVSYKCNLRCAYCFYLKVNELYPNVKHPIMNEKILETMISQYLGYQFQESIFGWQGGEPTLAGLDFFKNVVKLQQKYGKEGQIVGNALQTNGMVIDEDWCRFLNKYKFLVGLSLDGPKSVHDKYRKSIRGQSVWKKVMNAADLMRRYQVEYNILCVITKANVNRVKEIFQFFIDNGFYYLQFIPALEADETGKKTAFSINALQYGKFLCELFDLWKDISNKVSIRLFNTLLAKKMGFPGGFCTLDQNCADYLLIEWNGDVYPCDFFAKKSYKVGNLKKDDLAFLLNKRNDSFGKLKGQLSKECLECSWLTHCYGGCVKDRLFVDNPDPKKTYYCEGLKIFFEHSNEWFSNFANNFS
ncbi:MAG: anaerobic sulfatase maturase [Promethearchaeota archaeon]|nr:MAG: anaerobic sulfatase maturase [Candidatus Lokiarchaeota archaeon]